MSSTLRYAVQTHESTFSDSLLSSLPVAPPIIELVVALLLLLAIGTAEGVATGTALLLLLEPPPLAPATADAAEDDFEAPLNLAQLNLSPQLPFFDLAPVEDAALTATELEPLFDC